MSTIVIKHRQPVVSADDQHPGAIPEELLNRRDNTIRYQRDGAVYATDGKVGTLKRVVVDEGAGEVSDLVILVEASNRSVLVPPDLVDKTAGSAVFLTVNRTQFTERAAGAVEFQKDGFVRADAKLLVQNAQGARERSPKRAIATTGRDFVETPALSLLARIGARTGS